MPVVDEAAIARAQARGLATVLEAAGVELDGLWLHYFRLGGNLGVMEVEAYLHHALVLPALQRDLLACACNELAGGHPRRAPYTAECSSAGEAGAG